MGEQFIILSNGSDIVIADASKVSYHYRSGFRTELGRFDSYAEALEAAKGESGNFAY